MLLRHLLALELALVSSTDTTAVGVTPAAAAHLGAWQVDQHVMALHESGHAIAAALLGLPIRAIDIKGASPRHCAHGLTRRLSVPLR
jgi:hypothetical protein